MKFELDSPESVQVSYQLSAFTQLKAELIQVRSEKIELIESNIELSNELNLTKREFQNLKTDFEQEILMLKKDLEAKKSQLVELEHIFEIVKHEKSTLSINSNRLELELSAMKQKHADNVKVAEKAGAMISSLTNINRGKNATISQLRLSEERCEAELNKLKNELKAQEDRQILFESIKRSLKKVCCEDEKFCQSVVCDDDLENLSDPEICEIVTYVLEDFVKTKRQHLKDIYRAQVKLNGQSATIVMQASQIRNLFAIVNRGQTSTATTKTTQQLKMREKKQLEEISNLKKMLSHAKQTENNGGVDIRRLKVEKQKIIAHKNKTIATYITSLNELKGQVKIVS